MKFLICWQREGSKFTSWRQRLQVHYMECYMYSLSSWFNMLMFVYLFNFIVVIQAYVIVVTFLLFLPASISYRLLCGQGLIMACIKSVFSKLELVTWTCYTLNEIHLKNVYNIEGNMLDGRDYFHVPTIISSSWTSLLKLCSKQNVWSPVLWTCEIQHAILYVKVKNDFLVTKKRCQGPLLSTTLSL